MCIAVEAGLEKRRYLLFASPGIRCVFHGAGASRRNCDAQKAYCFQYGLNCNLFTEFWFIFLSSQNFVNNNVHGPFKFPVRFLFLQKLRARAQLFSNHSAHVIERNESGKRTIICPSIALQMS